MWSENDALAHIVPLVLGVDVCEPAAISLPDELVLFLVQQRIHITELLVASQQALVIEQRIGASRHLRQPLAEVNPQCLGGNGNVILKVGKLLFRQDVPWLAIFLIVD